MIFLIQPDFAQGAMALIMAVEERPGSLRASEVSLKVELFPIQDEYTNI
jgi:hypothetical protein